MKRILIIFFSLLVTILMAANAPAQDALELARAQMLGQQFQQFFREGRYKEALSLAQEILHIKETQLGPNDKSTAISMGNLASCHQALGEFETARSLFERELKIEKALYPQDSPEIATTINNLAGAMKEMGDLAAARPLFEKALEINNRALGSEHPDVAMNLENLASLLQDAGDYSEAKPLFEQALSIKEKTLAPGDPSLAVSLNNLAELLRVMGERKAARPLYERAIKIIDGSLGEEHQYAGVLANNLGLLLKDSGEYASARPYLEKALRIMEKRLGPQHFNVAWILNNLSVVYAAKGDYVNAIACSSRALKITESNLGKDHPTVTANVINLASYFREQGDESAARPLFERAENTSSIYLDHSAPALSSRQKQEMAARLRFYLDSLLSLQHFQNTDTEAVWRWKGRVSELLLSERAMALSKDNPQLLKLFNELASKRKRLADMAFSAPAPGRIGNYQESIRALEGEIEKLEIQLSQNSAEMNLQRRLRDIRLDQVQGALPDNSVLVDYLLYKHNSVNPETHKQEFHNQYLAVVVSKSKTTILRLGPAATIEKMVKAFREQVSNPTIGTQSIQGSGKELRRLVFDPVLTFLGELPDRFIIAPDGALHSVSFAALPGKKEGSYLIQDFGISYASSGKDLIRWQNNHVSNNGILVVGDPDFKAIISANSGNSRGSEDSSVCVDRNLIKNPSLLPGTRIEAEKILNSYDKNFSGGEILLGADATENLIKVSMQNKRYIHLATHGFFFSGQCGSLMRENSRGGGFSKDPFELGSGLTTGKPTQSGENPLLLSGLLFAGSGATNPHGGDDGVLTAAEVLNLNLSGADLVTLSACETGLGEVKSGEGIMGLRSAFVISGTRGLILTLWKVPDVETQQLMSDYYNHIFSGAGGDISDGLRSAMINAITSLSAARRHPSAWAAFTYTGPSQSSDNRNIGTNQSKDKQNTGQSQSNSKRKNRRKP